MSLMDLWDIICRIINMYNIYLFILNIEKRKWSWSRVKIWQSNVTFNINNYWRMFCTIFVFILCSFGSHMSTMFFHSSMLHVISFNGRNGNYSFFFLCVKENRKMSLLSDQREMFGNIRCIPFLTNKRLHTCLFIELYLRRR